MNIEHLKRNQAAASDERKQHRRKGGRPKGRNFPELIRADLSRAQKTKLENLAFEHDISLSAMVRRLIDEADTPNSRRPR